MRPKADELAEHLTLTGPKVMAVVHVAWGPLWHRATAFWPEGEPGQSRRDGRTRVSVSSYS